MRHREDCLVKQVISNDVVVASVGITATAFKFRTFLKLARRVRAQRSWRASFILKNYNE
jgi:hypothetical protein